MSSRVPVQDPAPSSRWLVGAAALLSLSGVAWLDLWTGRGTSFTFLYLVPVGVAAFFGGRKLALFACFFAALSGFVIALRMPLSLAADLWNFVGRLGIYLLFAMLVDRLHRHELRRQIFGGVARLLALCTLAAGALAGLGWTVQRHWPAQTTVLLDSLRPRPELNLEQLAARVEAALDASRPVLLGSRDPTRTSCIRPVKRGSIGDQLPPTPTDFDGGPGTSMTTLYVYDRQSNTSASSDFAWHQNRLRSYLENERVLNQGAWKLAEALSESAQELARQATDWSEIPADLKSCGYTRADNWPSYCLSELDRAIVARDLARARRWSGEFAEACFSLDDLHRWLDLLCENQVAALDFQKDCEALFKWTDAQAQHYDPLQSISSLPAGLLCLNGWGNYMEIERQAERLYTMPPDRLNAIAKDVHPSLGSLWVPPGVRAQFVQLRAALTGANQLTWDEAARTPYEHSYLINMLYRAAASGATDAQATILQRFDAAHPKATVGELMGVLMYRGHLFAGLEWSDRFEPELLEAAKQIPVGASDRDALMAVCRWTHGICSGPASYASTTTLRQALEEHKLDCVRATDMIGAIFRNSGRSRFGHVRWSAGTAAHSVAAYRGIEGGVPVTLLADGLDPQAAPESWPNCYFEGHAWPAGMESNPEPYAVELYIRGLDSYLWAEGYVVRGPQAGWLTKVRVPYSPWLEKPSKEKVYNGPFPQ